MTFEEIKASDRDFVNTTDIAPIMHVAPYSINVQAKKDPAKLGFPVVVVGTRVLVPRLGFIKFLEGTNT